MNATSAHDQINVLRQLFGDNRAEWPSAQFEKLFVEPTYLSKLEAVRPCFLVGGRGTGKTTSLQSLRYDSTLQRLQSRGQTFDDQEHLGVLVRMNKNRVRAFQRGGIGEERWSQLFAHYFNLIVSLELTHLAMWLEEQTAARLGTDALSSIATELGLEASADIEDLESKIKESISKLQLRINNPALDSPILLSIAESPLRTFVEAMNAAGMLGTRVVFCCIDEYENLLDYQQAIINTYIKHAEPPLSYKVGVRKSGLRNRRTLDSQDVLQTPDDFAEIEVAEEGFDYFARAVDELRLKYARSRDVRVPEKLH